MALLAALLWLLLAAGWLRPIEQRLYDMRTHFAADSTEPDPEIVVVAIDDQSLQALQDEWGRWPWPRNAMAQVIGHLSEAKLVALDILYIDQDSKEAEADAALVRAVQSHGNVLAGAYQNEQGAPYPPFPELFAACAGIGHLNANLDADGVIRKHQMQTPWKGGHLASLAVSAAQQADAELPPWNDEFLIRWSRQLHQVVPIRDLLQTPTKPKSFFRDKLVWIGSTATGLASRKVTSLRVYVPGVHIQAMATDNLLNHTRYRTLSPLQHILLLLVLALSLTFMVRAARPILTFVLYLGCIAIYVGAAWALSLAGWMLPLVVPVGMIGLGGILAAFQCWR